MGEVEGAKLAAIATRSTMVRYESAMARTWRLWENHETRVKAKSPSGDLSPAQAQAWASAQADVLLDGAMRRDDNLSTLDRKRAKELEQINGLQANQVRVLAGIVRGWAVQGEISAQQFQGWMEVAKFGAQAYTEHQHIKRLRREAEKAAAAEAAEEEEE